MLHVESLYYSYSKWFPCTPVVMDEFLTIQEGGKVHLGRYL